MCHCSMVLHPTSSIAILNTCSNLNKPFKRFCLSVYDYCTLAGSSSKDLAPDSSKISPVTSVLLLNFFISVRFWRSTTINTPTVIAACNGTTHNKRLHSTPLHYIVRQFLVQFSESIWFFSQSTHRDKQRDRERERERERHSRNTGGKKGRRKERKKEIE